ncbi:alanine racemase [Marinicella meishanensis]|uniref:alanine racemase n=1 Tax=Marinicella meishanensis TaxID=2873263 RepID=UPI001CBC0279|nr:alanine racemase [Marinicella sp. NBU2979]
MMLRERGTTATIHIPHITHNLRVFKRLHPGRLIAVVKADAYGHGLAHVVPALADCDAFAVATLEEALALRQLAPDKKIILLEGVFNPTEMKTAAAQRLDVVVHQDYQIKLLSGLSAKSGVAAWLKIDSGMHRLGFRRELAPDKITQLTSLPAVKQLRIMAHYATSEQAHCEQTKDQRQLAHDLKSFGLECSFSNTGAVLNQLADPAEWVRVGIGLYGISPLPQGPWGADFGLKPVMQLSAKIIASKRIKAGGLVGYGGHFQAPKDMRIGIVGIGYADGYPWSPHPSQVLVEDQAVAVLGRVSMDMMAIDLSAFSAPMTGAEVLIWGPGMPTEQVAKDLNLIPYALTCGITKRVKFNVVQ